MIFKRMKLLGTGLLCFLLCFLTLAMPILAAGSILLDKDVMLTIQYMDGKTPLTGARFELYRVADVDAYAYSKFTLTGQFSASGVSVNNLDSSGWRNAANSLAGYAYANNIAPLDSGSTDEDGMLTFPTSASVDMRAGLYLVVGDAHRQGGIDYVMEPMLVSMPMLNEAKNSWDYQGTISPKYEKERVPDEPQTTERKVTKVWNDAGFEHKRPAEISVSLLCDGKVYDTVTLNRENQWSFRWDELETGHTWWIVENSVPQGYVAAVEQRGLAFVITNTYTPKVETVDRTVIKIWNDDGNAEARPSEVHIELLRDGVVYDTVILTEDNEWKYHWNGLAINHVWTVREKSVPDGYTAVVTEDGSLFIVTNTKSSDSDTVSRQVIKLWRDEGHEAQRPESITVELLRNGEVYDTVKLSDANNWKYDWTNLPKDSEWTVHEAGVPVQYTVSTVQEGTAYILTNTYIIEPEPIDVEVLKIWKDEGHENERPKKITAALLRDGVVYETVALHAENGWSYQWHALDPSYTWTVKEQTVLDKYTSSAVRDGDVFIITNTYSVIPQTGQLWWPVPILLAFGLGMIVIGLIRRRGLHNEE